MTTPTLNGQNMLRATIQLPRWGVWNADIVTASDTVLSKGAAATIKLHGLELTGTVVDGGVHEVTGWYRVIAGAAKWASSIQPKAYRNQAGVKLSTILTDAANECGETLGQVGQDRVGPAFSRPTGPASRALDLLVPDGWYVDEVGKTQVSLRATKSYSDKYTLIKKFPGSQLIVVAADDVANLLPGAQIEGIEAATVRHELTPEGLRSYVYGVVAPLVDRAVGALRAIVTGTTRRVDYHRLAQYKITKTSNADGYVDIQPASQSLGLPDLSNIPMWVGGPGGGGDPVEGSLCLVAFADGDPTQPVIVAYEGESGNGWIPQKARLNASTKVEVGKDAGTVELAGGSQNIALANLVNQRCSAIENAFDNHIHSGGTISGSTGMPTTPLGAGSDTSASKSKAT